MASDLWNILLNVVAAFVYAGIVWLWQNKGRRPPPSPPRPEPFSRAEELELDRRTRNRQALESAAYKFFFYLLTFGVLYLSVTIPPLFKALFSANEVLLSQARFIGDSLPAIPVGKSYLQVTFFILAAVLFWPLLFLAEGIASLLYPIVDSFRVVTYRVWSAMTMLLFLLLCIPIAATSIWLFYEKSYQDSIYMVLGAIFLAFVLGQSQGERK